MNYRFVAPALVMLSSIASPAFAQDAGRIPAFELERLELNPGAAGSLLMGTGDLRPAGDLRVSLMAHHEQGPLSVYRPSGARELLVRSRVTTHLAGAYSPTDWLELGLQLPLVVRQVSANLDAFGLSAPAGWGLATPVVHARLGLLQQRQDELADVAVELGLGLPLGSEAALARDPGLRFAPKLTAGRTFGAFRFGGEAGVLLRPSVVLTPSTDVQDEVGSELRMGLSLSTVGQGLRGELDVRGALPLVRSPSTLEILGGGRLPIAKGAEVFALAGMGFGAQPGTPQFRVMVGLSFGGATGRSAGEAVQPGPLKADTGALVAKDGDQDGVTDEFDNCPRVAGPVPNRGCPGKPQLVVITREKLVTLDKIHFEFNQYQIKPVSYLLLDQLASVLLEHPEIKSVEIEGHTDSVGSDDYNLRLSDRRAEEVRNFLVRRGVEPSRLTWHGLGERVPIDTNATKEGRERNRRVEFHIRDAEKLSRRTTTTQVFQR